MKPIIMGAESVRAILDGRKTMTRRVDKINQNFWPEVGLDQDGKLFDVGYGDFQDKCHVEHLCPYGKIGDLLWVREAGWFKKWDVAPFNTIKAYKADSWDKDACPWGDVEPKHWISPMFMPRWASRITLEITDIRVERVQDITEEDAAKEGLVSYWDSYGDPDVPYGVCSFEVTAVEQYICLWDSLNAKRGYPWESNPWVWVISFRKVHDQK